MRKYPSGRRGSPAKGVGRQKRREGSNPSFRASKKRHPFGCLFLLHAADFALPPVKPPVDKPDQTVYTYCHQKGSDEEEAVFPRPKRGTPRLKASRQGHGPYHFRAACDEQDGYRPLQRSKATAYAGSLPPILRCRSLKYRPYSCAPAPCLDERYPAIRSGQ